MARLLGKHEKALHPRAFTQGQLDARAGVTANPYGHPVDRKDWERGHAGEFKAGRAELSSFASRAGKRR